MGMLEMAGAIGGIGRGIEKNVDYDRQKELMNLEEAREMRLRQFEAEQASKRQEAGFGHEEKMQSEQQGFAKGQQEKGFTHEEKMQGGEFGEREKLQKGTQTFESGEKQKDRASREKIAGIAANAATNKARNSALAKRWESKVVKQTTMGPDNVPTETEQLTLFDKSSGRAFIQQGNKFFPQGAPRTTKTPGTGKGQPATEKPIRDAAQSEIQKLKQNPDQADNFLRTYGYLPYEFFDGIGSNAGAYEPDTSASTPDDSDE